MRLEGLEPPRANPPAPKADASTNSATAADSRDSRSPTIANAWGSGQIGKAPVSKTGDSRFESWLPRTDYRAKFGSTVRFLACLRAGCAGRSRPLETARIGCGL